MRSLEDVLDELGGMGKFQILLVLLVESTELFVGWSMLLMSFAGLVPDFQCVVSDSAVPEVFNSSRDGNYSLNHWTKHRGGNSGGLEMTSSTGNSSILNVCSVNGSSCSEYRFLGDSETVMSEWGLVCDFQWVKEVINSVQMAGVALGAVMAGHLSDSCGRKITLYGFNLYHIIVNVIAAFSSSWAMYIVMRFLTGVGGGAILAVTFSFEVEFLPIKYRTLHSVLPTWALGVSVFALAAYFLENWWQLHLGYAICAAPSMIGWFFLPESPRFLALKGKLSEAMDVFHQIGKMNGRPVPKDIEKVLKGVRQNEKKQMGENKKYTYLDLFKTAPVAKASVICGLQWFTYSMIFYGLSYGVVSLSGNLYLNIFLMAVLELPLRLTTFHLNNKLGRKWATFGFYLLAAVPSLGVLLTHLLGPEGTKGTAIAVLCLLTKMFLGASWATSQIWVAELYPTTVRNLGYAWACFAARIGGIAAPFLINFEWMADASYVIMTVSLFVCTALCFFLSETKGMVLSNSFVDHQVALEDLESSDTSADSNSPLNTPKNRDDTPSYL